MSKRPARRSALSGGQISLLLGGIGGLVLGLVTAAMAQAITPQAGAPPEFGPGFGPGTGARFDPMILLGISLLFLGVALLAGFMVSLSRSTHASRSADDPDNDVDDPPDVS